MLAPVLASNTCSQATDTDFFSSRVLSLAGLEHFLYIAPFSISSLELNYYFMYYYLIIYYKETK